MPLDTLPILSKSEFKQIFDGKTHPVAERAEIESKEQKGDCVLVYVIGKTRDGKIIFSAKGKKEGGKYLAGGILSKVGIWRIDSLETYRPLQYQK